MKHLYVAVFVCLLGCTKACMSSTGYDEPNATAEPSIDYCSRIYEVSRDFWGAMAPKSVTNMSRPAHRVFIHHTADFQCSDSYSCWITGRIEVRDIQRFHMDDKGFDDLGYNWIVREDGRVYEGRGWDRVDAYTNIYNPESFGVAVIGNYTSQLPTFSALQAVKDLIACGVQKNKISSYYELYGHRQGRLWNECTECPGDTLYSHIKTWPRWSNRLVDPCGST